MPEASKFVGDQRLAHINTLSALQPLPTFETNRADDLQQALIARHTLLQNVDRLAASWEQSGNSEPFIQALKAAKLSSPVARSVLEELAIICTDAAHGGLSNLSEGAVKQACTIFPALVTELKLAPEILETIGLSAAKKEISPPDNLAATVSRYQELQQRVETLATRGPQTEAERRLLTTDVIALLAVISQPGMKMNAEATAGTATVAVSYLHKFHLGPELLQLLAPAHVEIRKPQSGRPRWMDEKVPSIVSKGGHPQVTGRNIGLVQYGEGEAYDVLLDLFEPQHGPVMLERGRQLGKMRKAWQQLYPNEPCPVPHARVFNVKGTPKTYLTTPWKKVEESDQGVLVIETPKQPFEAVRDTLFRLNKQGKKEEAQRLWTHALRTQLQLLVAAHKAGVVGAFMRPLDDTFFSQTDGRLMVGIFNGPSLSDRQDASRAELFAAFNAFLEESETAGIADGKLLDALHACKDRTAKKQAGEKGVHDPAQYLSMIEQVRPESHKI